MSNALRQKVFPGAWDEGLSGASGELLALAKEHLRHAGLLGKKTKISEPIDIPNCPELVASSDPISPELVTNLPDNSAQPTTGNTPDRVGNCQQIDQKADNCPTFRPLT